MQGKWLDEARAVRLVSKPGLPVLIDRLAIGLAEPGLEGLLHSGLRTAAGSVKLTHGNPGGHEQHHGKGSDEPLSGTAPDKRECNERLDGNVVPGEFTHQPAREEADDTRNPWLRDGPVKVEGEPGHEQGVQQEYEGHRRRVVVD
ncbi:MAG: hypothetical protein U5O39_02460 [Gammaproteobacteria bacterium]|nr:hypothetical protein [Gammaproteobacteria bacterium]